SREAATAMASDRHATLSCGLERCTESTRPAAVNELTMRPEHLARLREICLGLPDATEKIAWGDPTWRVRDKIFAMAKGNYPGGRRRRRRAAGPRGGRRGAGGRRGGADEGGGGGGGDAGGGGRGGGGRAGGARGARAGGPAPARFAPPPHPPRAPHPQGG